MTKKRLDGLYLLLLGAAVCVLFGGVLETVAPAKMSDFKAIYYSARCVIHNSDPYQSGEILREVEANGEQFPSDPAIARPFRRAILTCINLPTSLFLVAPFAMFPWGLSHVLWMILTTGSLLLAAYLMWDLGANFAPVLAGAFAACVLANSEALLINGNSAAVVVGLGLIAVWCFIKNRFPAAGVLCLALSLSFKPHDIGFVWLYFLMAGGVLRKRAIQSLVLTVAISLPAIFWVWHVSPHWMTELHSNLVATSARGDLNDLGPSSMGAHTMGMVVSLQTVVSMVHDDPGFYNPATYLITGPLILIWLLIALRSRFSKERMWLALAVISALSLLPVYHRIYDAKLLLLSIPACAMLWAEGGLIAWLALAINLLALLFTSDLPWVFFSIMLSHLRPTLPWLSGPILNAIVALPAPTMLLLMSIFYLWIYVRRSSNAAEPARMIDKIASAR